MARSAEEIAKAAAESEAWMNAVEPDELPASSIDDRKDLRQIGTSLIAIETAERALVSAVSHARAHGRSWTEIANVLGVSRQAARQRFDGRVEEPADDHGFARIFVPRTSSAKPAAAIVWLTTQRFWDDELSSSRHPIEEPVDAPMFDSLSKELMEMIDSERGRHEAKP